MCHNLTTDYVLGCQFFGVRAGDRESRGSRQSLRLRWRDRDHQDRSIVIKKIGIVITGIGGS